MVKIHWPEPGWPPEKYECMCDERDYQIIDKGKQYFLEKGFPCQNSATHCLISGDVYTFLCERHAGRVPDDAGELIELPDSTFRVEKEGEENMQTKESLVGKYLRVFLEDDRVFEGKVVLDQEDLLDIVQEEEKVNIQFCIPKDLIFRFYSIDSPEERKEQDEETKTEER